MQEFKGFNTWFKIMWNNFFIQLFMISLAFIALTILLYGEIDTGFFIAISIPALAAIITVYKGFYQFWNDLKNNRSR